MRNTIFIDVDFNGIIIFDYPGILELFDGKIKEGQNILKELTSPVENGKIDKGKLALDKGIALPIMGIDDGSYCVRFFLDELPTNDGRKIIFTDKYFYLQVTKDLYVADMAVFWDWEDYTSWHKTNIPKGIYKVSLQGVHLIKKQNTFNSYEAKFIKNGEILDCYDLILEKVSQIGIREIEPRSDSRLF